jgi:nicotinamidase-related amidase
MSKTPRRALVVIDVQNEYFIGRLPIEYPPVDVSVRNIARAMDAAREAGIPVVVVQHTAPEQSPLFAKGSATWALHEEVARRPRDHHIEKTWPSVFTETDFADWLKVNEIDTIAVTGYMTQNCNASTIYEAAHRGFEVEMLNDATGAVPYANSAGHATAEEVHRVLSVIFHTRFASVTSTADWIAAVNAKQPIARDNIPASNARARSLAAAG